ncbi:hypothetical protein [Epilithonimonas sp.]|jgi:hypothetical protein|uniref:hypothetical protein n=1 Tax=Epilithonimonas sp. TaxID=2894511 RepID=UPI0035B24B0A
MLSFKLPMKKYLTLLYIGISLMSAAQFKENTFDQQSDQNMHTNSNDNNTFENGQSATGVPVGGEHEEGPGNPGEPVPIDGLVPVLLLSSVALLAYFHRKNKSLI